jgi:hypothetical protein
MSKWKTLCLIVPALFVISSQNASAVFIEFEDLPLSHTYNVGDSFTTSGIQVQVENFYPRVGGPQSGTALVDNLLYAGGGGNELTLNNVNLRFLLNFDSCPDCGLSLLFYHMQGDIDLGINADILKAADFSGLPTIIGGAQVFVGGSYPYGIIYITGGNIQSFTIGGQQLYIDNITTVPEPATIMLLGLGSLGLLRNRKNKTCSELNENDD